MLSRVGSGGIRKLTGLVGPGQEFFESHGSGRVGSGRVTLPARNGPTREKPGRFPQACQNVGRFVGSGGLKQHRGSKSDQVRRCSKSHMLGRVRPGQELFKFFLLGRVGSP